MVKRGRSGKKEGGSSKRRTRDEYVASEEMDDEIDAFHKQRDIVPLDDSDEDSDDDNEQPVLDFVGTDNEESDEDDDMEDTGLAAKIVRQQKYLRATMGGDDDELNEEEEEGKDDRVTWGKSKGQFYNADQAASSDEDLPAEEEEEVLRLEKKRAEALSLEDFGNEDGSEDESDREPTLGEIAVRGDTRTNSVTKRTGDDGPADFEEVKKDLNALSKEEQMDVVYSSAPELVGLLSELKDATEELESRINPLLSKARDVGNITKEGIRYLEVKQILLLAYCQAITFYLLLKSEGQVVRDHPVIGRLVEIKNLLEKVNELDGNLPANLEEILDETDTAKAVKPKEVQREAALSFGSFSKDNKLHVAHGVAQELADALEAMKSAKLNSMKKKNDLTTENGQLGAQSMKMLKVRASLEEKLKEKGLLSSAVSKEESNKKQQKPLNGRLETRDDFDDDATGNLGANSGLSAGRAGVSSLLVAKQKKAKVISGDDDLPTRDDIGERRNKFERRVLQRAGVGSDDEGDKEDDDTNLGSSSGQEGTEADESSEDEFYQQVKKEREAKLAAKADKFSRTTADEPSFPDTVDGKRHITYQMEKNRGLTRPRKKQDKNPRKKYRTKADKQMKRRGGQVQKIRKPSGPYGGEATGINAGISRSIRFKG